MIGILTPMRAEFIACIEHLEGAVSSQGGPFEASAGKLGTTGVVICRCGIGKSTAAAGAQWLIDNYAIKMLLLCGAAGSLVTRLKLGDVIIAEEIIAADCGFWGEDGFLFTGTIYEGEPGLCFETAYAASDMLLAAARSACDEMKEQLASDIQFGRIVTCDQATFARSRRDEFALRFSALAVEMEGAAAAQVARLNALPCLVLRAISDEIDFCPDIQEERSMAEPLLRRPDLQDAIALAAGNAARFTVATIGHIS